MTFKAILEGTIRRDASRWVTELARDAGYRLRLVEAEKVDFLGRNDQAVCHVEVWHGEFDQTGLEVIFNLEIDGIHPVAISDSALHKSIWYSMDSVRKNKGIDRFQLTRREF